MIGTSILIGALVPAWRVTDRYMRWVYPPDGMGSIPPNTSPDAWSIGAAGVMLFSWVAFSAVGMLAADGLGLDPFE